MKDIIVEIGTSVACLLIATVCFYAAKWFHVKCQELKMKTDSDALRYLLDKIDFIVQTCVEATNQTFVDDLKNDNNFNQEQQEQAFQTTFESIENMLTDEDKQKIIDSFGDMGTFIRNSVENYIRNSKPMKDIDIPL